MRFLATTVLFAGVSVFVAAVPVAGLLGDSPDVRRIRTAVLLIGGVFAIGGGAAGYLSRPRGRLLPNERATMAGAETAAVGGWLILLAVALVALPVWLFLRLQPFLTEWRRVIDLALATPGLWDASGGNASGIVLLPIFGALTPPFLELATAVMFPIASIGLLALLIVRSVRFPRAYLVWSILLSTLVIASWIGANAALIAVDAIQRIIDGSNPRPDEVAQFRDVLGRYTRAVSTTAPELGWTLCGYLIWLPAMVLSRRVHATFATAEPHATAARPLQVETDIEAITRPPDF
jgi:hypothetical protein